MSYERSTATNDDYGRCSGGRPSGPARNDDVDNNKESASNNPLDECKYQHRQHPNSSSGTSGVSPLENGRDRRNRDMSDRNGNERVYDGGKRTRSRSRSRGFHSEADSMVRRGKGSRIDDDYDREGRRGGVRDRELYGNGYSRSARGDDYHEKREIGRGDGDARGYNGLSASSNCGDTGRGVDQDSGAGERKTEDRRSLGDSRELRRDYSGDRGYDGRGIHKRGGYDGGSRGEFVAREDRERDWSRGRGAESGDDRGRGRDRDGGSFGGRDRVRDDSREMQQRGYGGRDSFRGGSGGSRRNGREEFVSRNRRYPEDDRRRRYFERDSSIADRRRGDDSRPRVGGFGGKRADSRDRSRQRVDDVRREVKRRGYGDTRDDGATGPRPRTSSHVGEFVDGKWVGGPGSSSDGGVHKSENSKASSMMGGIAPVGSSSIVTPGILVNSSGSGRPRWDKPAPGAVAKEAIASIERKMTNNEPGGAQQQMSKKLIWSSGKSAGSKRPLWGGSAAGTGARFVTSSAAGIASGTPGGGSSSENRVS